MSVLMEMPALRDIFKLVGTPVSYGQREKNSTVENYKAFFEEVGGSI